MFKLYMNALKHTNASIFDIEALIEKSTNEYRDTEHLYYCLFVLRTRRNYILGKVHCG